MSCEGLWGTCSAPEAADAALMCFRKQGSLPLLLCLNALVANGKGLLPMENAVAFLCVSSFRRLH